MKKYIVLLLMTLILCGCSGLQDEDIDTREDTKERVEQIEEDKSTEDKNMKEQPEKDLFTREDSMEEEEEVLDQWVFTPLEGFENIQVLGLIYSHYPIEEGNIGNAPITDGFYLAEKDGWYGLLDTEGNWFAQPEYKEISYYYDYYMKKDYEYETPVYSVTDSKELCKTDAGNQIMGTAGARNALWDVDRECLMLSAYADISVDELNFEYKGTLPVKAVETIYHPEYGYAEYNFVSDDSKYALCTNGTRTTEFEYDDVAAYSDGLIAVEVNGKWGYVNPKGTMVIPAQYDAIRSNEPSYESSINYSAACYPENYSQEMVADYLQRWRNRYVGAACTEGYVVLGQDGEYALADRAGTIVIPFGEYDVLTEVQNGRMYAKKNGQWGLLELENK